MREAVIFAAAAVAVWSIFKADKTADWSSSARYVAIAVCIIAGIIPAALLATGNSLIPPQGTFLCAVPIFGAWQIWRTQRDI